MSLWFRFYSGVVDDPKAQMLSPELFKFWVNLLCLAAKHDGALPPLPVTAFALRVTEAKASEVILRLHSAELLDKTEDGFTPHNWDFRQFKGDKVDATNADRQRRFREKRRNNNCESNIESNTNSNGVTPVTAKRPEYRVQNTDTDTDKKKDSPLRSDDWPDDYGDQFWRAYPLKKEKLSAMGKLKTLRKSGKVTFADLMMGVKRYADLGTEPKYTKHPTTWLNAGCWADELILTQTRGSNGNGTHNQAKRSASADFFAGIASVAADISRDGNSSWDAAEDVPFGRVNIDG